MVTYEKYDQYRNLIREQAELEVFNLVGELLSISFEKYDVEVIIESDEFLNVQPFANEVPGEMKTEIDFEDIVENKNILEITLSGKIKGRLNYMEAFMLYFSLSYDPEINGPWKPCHGKVNGINSLSLKFGRKAEQLSDPVFRVSWDHEDSNGNRQNLGEGRGILVFFRDKELKAN